MEESSKTPVTIAVDLKRYCIRIHKNVFRMIGEPNNIEFLVNPIAKYVAIHAVSESAKGIQLHRINKQRLKTCHSYEIYSKEFVTKLCMIVGGLDEGCGYWLKGKIVPEEDMAVFFLKTLQRIER